MPIPEETKANEQINPKKKKPKKSLLILAKFLQIFL